MGSATHEWSMNDGFVAGSTTAKRAAMGVATREAQRGQRAAPGDEGTRVRGRIRRLGVLQKRSVQGDQALSMSARADRCLNIAPPHNHGNRLSLQCAGTLGSCTVLHPSCWCARHAHPNHQCIVPHTAATSDTAAHPNHQCIVLHTAARPNHQCIVPHTAAHPNHQCIAIHTLSRSLS